MYRIGNKIQFRKYDINSTAAKGRAPDMEYMNQILRKGGDKNEKKKEEAPVQKQASLYDSLKINKGNRPYDFQSEFDYGVKLFDWDSAAASRMSLAAAENGYIFRFSKVRPYFVRFMVDNVVAQVDNITIVTRYQPFDPSSPAYKLNSLGFLIKVGVTDLLENYK